VLGDAAPLTDLAEVAGEYDAGLVVDEAHALGVAGVAGRGLVNAEALSDRCDVAVTATLSKALGAQGGVVLGGGDLVDHLVNAARSFIYDTGLAPGSAAAALRALEVVREEPERPARALAVAARIADASGLDAPAGCVLSVPMRTPADALAGQQRLADAGFRVGCFRPPSVPGRVSRLRLTAKAMLGDDDVDRLVRELARLPGVLR
jgi:8-amino-7-oxononanoate synthase